MAHSELLLAIGGNAQGPRSGGSGNRPGGQTVSTTEAVPCLLCAVLARRWLDRQDRLRDSRIYRCAACGGRFAVTGDALGAIEQGRWDVAELKAAVRQNIASGVLPRIEDADGRPSVIAIGRQAS